MSEPSSIIAPPAILTPHLPVELVIHIIELVYFGEDELVDRQTLRSCSQVCSLWRDPAQRLLLRSFCLNAAKHPLPFLKDIFDDSVRGRLLCSYVRVINVHTATHHSFEGPTSFYSSHHCAEILTLFPNLYELTLILTHSVSESIVDSFHLAAKRDSFPRRIRSLNIHGFSSRSSLLYRLLSLWSTIQFLSISSAILCRFLPPPQERPPLELVQLQFSIEVPGLDLLRWLAYNHSLRILELRHIIITASPINIFLTEEGRYLRSLRLIHSDLVDPIASSLDSLCPALEELVLETRPRKHIELLINHLPKSLEHVQLLGSQFSRIPAFLCDVVCALPRLRVLTLSSPVDGGHDTVVRRELGDECAARGVKLVFVTHDRLPDDPVMVNRFPRERSVSHFRLMN